MTAGNTGTSKGSVLLVAAVTTFMAPFMISSVNIALPALQHEFAADAVALGWIANAYLLASGVVLVPVGKLSDIFGRKKMFVAGIFIFTLFTIAIGFSPSIPWIIGLRIFQGIGSAMTMSTGIAIITSVFPPQERGGAIGLTVASVYIGLSAGPFAGGFLTSAFGWRSIFWVVGPIGLAALILAVTRIRDEWRDAQGDRLDIAGSLLYGLSLMAVMCGLSSLPSRGGLASLGIGILGASAFVWQELRTPQPVFEIRLFHKNRAFSFSSLAALINYSATFAVSFLLSLYLQYIKGLTPEEAGVLLICQPMVMAVFSPLAGRLSDRTEPAIIASIGMGLTATGLMLLTRLGTDTSTGYIISSLTVLGLGFALFSSPNMNAIMSSVEKRYFGIASSAVATMRLIGQMLSMTLVTLIFSFILGKNLIAPPVYPEFLYSVAQAFTLFSLLCVVGIYFSLARGTIKKRPPRPAVSSDNRS